MQKTAAAYIRVSTEEQLEFSPDSQLCKIKEYANRNNIIIPEEFIFIDEGISGRKAEKRPAFMNMIAVAKTKPKPFDMILVWKFSRFARNREDSVVYKSMLRKQCGIEVISVSEQIGEDKTAILIEALLEAMDEYYSINLAEEVKRGMNEKFSRGGVVSIPPFGYRMGDGKFVPDEKNAIIVKMIFDEYISGKSIRGIAEILNNMGIRSSRGNRFESRTVEYIISNPTYTGKLRRGSDSRNKADRFYQSSDTVIINGQHEPIISDEIFEIANKRLTESKKRRIKYSNKKNADFMLHGLVRCSSCFATLVQSVKGTSLQCCRYARGQCNISHSITIKKLNEAVIKKLKEDLGDFALTFEPNETKKIRTAEMNNILLKKEYAKLEKIKTAYISGVDSIEEYKLNKSEIIKIIESLKENIENKPKQNPHKKITVKLSEFITDGDISEDEKNMFLSSIISQIIFDRKSMSIIIIYR
ncbi:MAG: recombinase family protein [Huintestinicola sp.]